ncbi:MAG: hypothetical protein A3G27_03170 [Betaproteobacteria bacterium RIFCSPLOWO2_12_FULL_66_14]|nr:MAG: hypothetical protein A3G27_03170 [Betaproteobacteria bacterium RIFCSPLOWO2_12_FULL_66_14]
MRTIAALLLSAFLAAGCATLEPGPPPLNSQEIIALAKAGESPEAIIQKLEESRTVLLLSASQIVRLYQAGVPQQVLDHLQRVQIEEIRRREAFAQMRPWPPFYGSYWDCPWLYRPYPFGWRARPYWWGC